MSAIPVDDFVHDNRSITAVREICERAGLKVSTSMGDRLQRGRDDSYLPPEPPDMVAFAKCTDDVVTVAKACYANDVPFMAFGAGTSTDGHVMARKGGVTIDMSAMNAILSVDAEDFRCTVQAGVVRQALNTYLRDTGLFFPIDASPEATIGGMVSTRASGTNAVRYGTMRDNVITLEVVLSDGRVLRTGGFARKSAAGYDLTRLFTGAGGTLGIITEVTIRLHPIPEYVVAATCAFENVGSAVEAVCDLMRQSYPIGKVEILDAAMMRMVNNRAGLGLPELPHLFFEFAGSESVVQEGTELTRQICSDNGGIGFADSSDPAKRRKLWEARHGAGPAAAASRPNGAVWATDVTVPVSRLAEAIEATQEILREFPLPSPILGHVGDGNYHVCFVVDPESAEERAMVKAANDSIVQKALAMGGTCTGEHGIGYSKNCWMEEEFGQVAVDVMRSIKKVIDPKMLLNPGKIFDD